MTGSMTFYICTLAVFCAAENLWTQTTGQGFRKDTVLVPGQPYERYFTRDNYGREITFYLSEQQGTEPLPLAVYIQGSGCSSLFQNLNGRVVPSLGHISVYEAVRGKMRVLLVEKPGVQFLESAPRGCGEFSEFNSEHTLERWAEAVRVAITAAQSVQGIRQGNVMVVGHSEGGLVACRVARSLPELVSHVAIVAGGGPSQLEDILTLTRKRNFFGHVSDDPQKRVDYVLEQWRAIQSDPTSAEKFFFGFSYRRWATFLATSPIEELPHVPAAIYIAQGTEDAAVDPASADSLYAHLVARGKRVTYDRVEEADHSFNLKDKPDVNGWQELFVKIVEWYGGS